MSLAITTARAIGAAGCSQQPSWSRAVGSSPARSGYSPPRLSSSVLCRDGERGSAVIASQHEIAMGFNVNSHVVKGEFDADGLKALLPGIPFAASRIKGHDCIFLSIDVPYLTRNEALAPNLPNPYAALHQLYRALEADGVAVCFNRGLANLNLKLSKLFEGSVLSIESSDDMVDFTVASACGLFTGLQFKAEDVEVVVEDGNIHIYPLVTELAETVVDLSIFDGGPFVVHGRDRLETDDVNRIARLVLKAFLNTEHDVVDILLEDLSHEDEELIYRHDGR